jgi:hypothetical protein
MITLSWGWCQLFVFGDIGTRLKIIEYPLAESQKGFRPRPAVLNCDRGSACRAADS